MQALCCNVKMHQHNLKHCPRVAIVRRVRAAAAAADAMKYSLAFVTCQGYAFACSMLACVGSTKLCRKVCFTQLLSVCSGRSGRSRFVMIPVQLVNTNYSMLASA